MTPHKDTDLKKRFEVARDLFLAIPRPSKHYWSRRAKYIAARDAYDLSLRSSVTKETT